MSSGSGSTSSPIEICTMSKRTISSHLRKAGSLLDVVHSLPLPSKIGNRTLRRSMKKTKRRSPSAAKP